MAYRDAPAAAAIPVAIPVAAPRVRSMYVRKADLDKYGGTEDCRACVEISSGIKTVVRHSDACRERITTLLENDKDNDQAQERLRKRRALAGEAEPDRPGESGEAEVPAGDAAGEPDAIVVDEEELEDLQGQPSERRVPGRIYRRKPESGPSTAASSSGLAALSSLTSKRASDTAVEDLDPQSPTVAQSHIDSDVQLPLAARAQPAAGAASSSLWRRPLQSS